MEKQTDGQRQKFCRTYLRTMDADQAAAAAGYQDGYARLRTEPIRQCLRRMREAAAGELRQEDVLRQLAHLAFGRADDVLRLALRPGETEAYIICRIMEIQSAVFRLVNGNQCL